MEHLDHQLNTLATEIFPDYDIGYLRDLVQKYNHSHLEQVALEVILHPSYPERLNYGEFDRIYSIRHKYYQHQALEQLSREYPHILKSSIRAVLLEHHWDYISAREELKLLGTNRSKNRFERSEEAEEIAARLITDHELALQWNMEEYTRNGQLITCVCCFDEYPFEEISQATLARVVPDNIWRAYEKFLFDSTLRQFQSQAVYCKFCEYCQLGESVAPLHVGSV
ncbi:uncharacterized protein BYT42DRAFT_616432 [Radiomyces spectabilis]|uniref:uncharacterized protein n=1 Tax=Radiomyces spectabilis TaxID=64574 RepID=UPI0022211760|nr:uncharacterized protein BYT42DRAFT_616432 [Radiomyces spectabilis]KAI8371335.1 hypothetical protein BYT42DRAFT_616432 [Radiomyces spectabilis]